MAQQSFHFEKVHTVTINQQAPTAQSKDEIIKARLEPRDMDKVRAFCQGRQISVSDYVRQHLRLDPSFLDLIDTLNESRDFIVPLLKRMSKNF